MRKSVIVVGASGNFGPFLVNALVAEKANLGRIAILSAPEKKDKFVHWESQGVETILGSFIEATSYKGGSSYHTLIKQKVMLLTPSYQALMLFSPSLEMRLCSSNQK
jgi:hypothetical protein